MEVRQITSDLFKVIDNDRLYLSIATGIPINTIPTNRLEAIQKSMGIIVRDDALYRWNQSGVIAVENDLHLVGPFLMGVTFHELLNRSGGALAYVSRLARALACLAKHNIMFLTIHVRLIIFLNDGGILFLSNELVHLLCDFQSPNDRLRFTEPFNHPTMSGVRNYSFALAVLTYFSLTGHIPWDAHDAKELKDHILSGVIPDVHYYNQEIRSEVVQEISATLCRPKHAIPSLDYWQKFFKRLLLEGTHDAIDTEERKTRYRKSHGIFHQLKKSYTRRMQIRDNRLRIIGLVVLFVSIISIPVAIVQNSIDYTSYRSFSPRDIVETYYAGINRLDSQDVQKMFVAGYDYHTIAETDTVYRMSRLRRALRFQNPIVNPVAWAESGRPFITEKRVLYGVNNLSIKRIFKDEHQAEYIATFQKWTPQQLSKAYPTNGVGKSVVFVKKEKVILSYDNSRWAIQEIIPIVDIYY